jgi:DNA-binding NarL/FixJ family response regulator
MPTENQPEIADFTNRFKQLEPNRRMVASWLLSSEMRLKFVFAIAPRLSLAFICTFVRQPNMVVGAVTGEDAALGYITRERPGLLICSDLLEQGDGYSLVRRARAVVADLRVVMVMHSPTPDVRQARDLKIEGIFCNSDIGKPKFSGIQAVIAAGMGKSYLSPDAERHLLEQGGTDEDPNLRLTRREEEILNLIIQGCSDRQIAEQLQLSYETARTYGKTVRRKLGAKSRLELVGRAMDVVLGRRS